MMRKEWRGERWTDIRGQDKVTHKQKRRCRVTGTGKKGKGRVTVWLDTI